MVVNTFVCIAIWLVLHMKAKLYTIKVSSTDVELFSKLSSLR